MMIHSPFALNFYMCLFYLSFATEVASHFIPCFFYSKEYLNFLIKSTNFSEVLYTGKTFYFFYKTISG